MKDHCEAHSRYRKGCEPCLLAGRAYNARIRRLNAYGKPRTLPAGEAQAHIQQLVDAGVTPAGIARAAGVHYNTIWRLMRAGDTIIRRDIHDKIMAVRSGKQVWVDSAGTRRRLHHLYLMGWSGNEIARRSGVSQAAVSKAALGVNPQVKVETAAAIGRVFRELWTTDGGSRLAKNKAAKDGFVSILAYDDPDDPTERPKGNELEGRRARLDILAELADMGKPWTHDVVVRAGFPNTKAAVKAAKRAGRSDVVARMKLNLEAA